jgi:hypothetical protein
MRCFRPNWRPCIGTRERASHPCRQPCWRWLRCCRGYLGVSDAEAVELSVVDRRWKLVLDCLEATEPPFSQGALGEFRARLLRTELDRRLLERMVEVVRRTRVDTPSGYRNGYGKPRRLSLTSGTIMARRPRVRGLEGRFVSRILPLFKRRTQEVGELLPELYLHRLALGDFELALRGLLGEEAPFW